MTGGDWLLIVRLYHRWLPFALAFAGPGSLCFWLTVWWLWRPPPRQSQ